VLRASPTVRERGQVVVLFALMIPVVFAIGAVVIDIGNWYVHKRHLQTQVDAAVLASAPAFVSCFFDQTPGKTVANGSIETTALGYAGDTLRNPTTANKQLAEPGDVRIVLNADRYWDSTDGTSSASTGYGLDNGGNNPAKMPCATSSLEAKATDEHVRPLWGLIPLTPSPKAHAKVEIHRVREENGFLPIAVPEVDPSFAYAIFVDYANDGTKRPLAVQKLQKNPAYLAPGFLYSDWETAPNTVVPNNESVSIHPNNTYSDGTGVVILVSKSDTAPTVTTSMTLNEICGQAPTDLVACYSGQGKASNDPSYNGAATGQGLAFIHSYATSNGRPDDPRLLDVNLGTTVCTGGISPGNQSYPYFVNDDNDCTVQVTAKVDFGVLTTPPNGDPTVKPSAGGYCAQVGSLNWSSTNGSITTWTGTMPVQSATGPQVLTLSWSDKTAGTNCNNPPNFGTFGPATMSYSQDDVAGPVGYMHLTAGSTATCSSPSQPDGNSVPRGTYCYTVDVGLSKPLSVQPWNFPNLVLRFASKSARKNGSGNANLNGSLLCDAGRTLERSFVTGCYTTYGLNFDKWGVTTTPPPATNCAPGAYCWKDVLCSQYPPNSLPPASTVNNPPPICIQGKNGKVDAFQKALYDRFEDPANGFGGCGPNNWPTDATTAANFFKPVDQGGYDFTNDPRYVTLVVTDNTAFSDPNRPEPVKYFAGFYVTGWDTANGAGHPSGCYGYSPINTCGAPNNDPHPLLGCYPGSVKSSDNGDVWGHFVKFVGFSSTATPSDDLCDLTSASPETCVATLVE
jgi:hypothetical protein